MTKPNLLAAVVLALLLAESSALAAETIHFREGGGTGYTDALFDDTWINYDPADNNTHGDDSYNGIRSTTSALSLIAVKDMFTQLPVTSSGANIQINSATLHLFRYQGSSSNVIELYRVTTNWLPDDAGSNENDVSGESAEVSESTTWDSGDFSTSDYDTSVCCTSYWVDNYNQLCQLDVSDIIEDVYDNEANYGLLFTADSSGVYARASEYGTLAYRPSLEITYEYIQTTFSLTVNSGTGDGNYAQSATPTITADAAPSGQEFAQWVGDTSGIASQTSSPTTLTMPAANQEVTATYTDKTWTLTVNNGTGGGSYVVGVIADIDADSAASGKQFDQWIGDTAGIASVTTADTTLTMPYANAEVTATYEDIPTYTLTVNSGSGDGSYAEGVAANITADAADSGKFFDAWIGDTSGIADVNDSSTTLTMPATNAEVTATYTWVANGLVSRFTFDIDASDSYGSNDGVLTDGASVTTDGTRGLVVSLDGADDYVNMPTSEMSSGMSELTLSLWIKPDELVSTNTIWDEHDEWYWQFSISHGMWATRDSSTGTTGSRDNDLSLPSLASDQWQHLAFVYSVTGSNKAIYLDGVLGTSTSTSIDTLTASRDGVYLGRPSDGNYFDGMIDDVRLYNRALNATEIALLAEQDFYTLVVNSGSGDGDYVEDQVVNITAGATPSGQDFDQWTGDTANIASVTSSSTTITMPAANAEVTATYTDKTWTLTVNSGTGGGSYAVGSIADIDADSPASGKQFDQWVGDTAGIASVTTADTTLTMPYANAEITATYEDAPSGTTQLIVNWGDSVGNNVYDFSDWDSVYLGQYTGYSSLGPDGLVGGWTGTAVSGALDGSSETFSEGDQIVVTWYNSGTGSRTIDPKVSFDDPDRYGSGTSGTWYDMSQLVCSGETSGTTTYTFTAGTAGDYDLVNVCRYTTGDVEEMVMDKVELVTDGGGGTTYTLTVNSGSGDGSYAESTNVNISADAAPSGQVFDEWTGDTANIASVSSSSTTITMPAANAEITATYEAAPTYTLTVNSGSGDGNYVESQVVQITANSAPSGYVFDEWTGDTANIGSVSSASTSITMPAANAEITATYGAATLYTLTVNSGSGDGSYQESYVASISANSPASGKQFDDWIGDTFGIANVNSSSTTLTMPAANAEITATYEDIPAGSGPSISSTSGTWSHGNSVTIAGTGFGSKSTAAPIRWETFEDGTVGTNVTTTGYWSAESPAQTLFDDDSNISTRHSNSDQHIRWDGNGWPGSTGKFYKDDIGFANTGKAYVNLWLYMDFISGEGELPTGWQVKLFRIHGDSNHTSKPLFYSNLMTDDDQTVSYWVCGVYNTSSIYPGADWMEEHYWVNMVMEYKDSTSINTADGEAHFYSSRPNHTSAYYKGSKTSVTTRDSTVTNYVDCLSMGYLVTNGGDYADTYWDDVYIDNSWARVEIGDSSTYANCTHREMQIPSAWSGTSVTVTVNQGSHSSFTGKYLFVVDEEGNVSSGYAL